MSITLEVNGTDYTRFTSASASISLDTVAREFFFEAVSTEATALPFKGGEPCRVIVDNAPVLTGFIEIVDISYDSQSHTIGIQGRSKTGDLIDSTLSALELTPPISLAGVIEKVIEQVGATISVIDDSGGIEDFNKAEDKISPFIGEGAFEFIERLARKRQVLVTSDGNGDIVITRSDPTLLGDVILQNIINSDDNNILAATMSYNHTQRFRDYVVKSQQNASALIFSGEPDLASVVDQSGGSSDPDARSGRRLVIKSEKASSSEQDTDRATWEANIRRARSQMYFATVQGFSLSDGTLWEVNRLVNIVDQFADINARMLINSIVFNFDISSGSTTDVGFVDKDAYTLALEEPQPVDKVGTNVFSFS